MTLPSSWPLGAPEPPRVPLARGDTPFQPLKRTTQQLGHEVWVKRDDLTGSALSGNKVRKLEYLVAEAESRGAPRLVTCGGVNSNHARATAVAAAQRGLRSHLLLRGEDRVPPVGNLLLDRWVGAEITFVDADGYAERNDRMAALAGSGGYVIPEGGSNGLGALGMARCALELVEDARTAGVEIGRVVHACGSGGSTAGLALGFAAAGVETDVVAVNVMKDAAFFTAEVERILADVAARGHASEDVLSRARFRIQDGFVGEGYARTTSDEMAELQGFAQTEGLVVDPVYTGKALLALLRNGLGPPPSRGVTVFVHTGGIFELFAYAAEIAALRS
ncbi:MAG: pyridoxal-phosphate dependent enzyme [Myxococcota bacterium]